MKCSKASENLKSCLRQEATDLAMKAAVYYSQNDVRLEDVPKPRIGEDEALVEMKACGVCGSDLMDWYLRDRVPLVLGHEPTGLIAEKGASVRGFEIGDRVFVHHHVACLQCHYCLRGDFTLCHKFHETNIVPGGFAEFFKVPGSNLQLDTLRLPDDLSFEVGTLIEPVGCCLRGLHKCDFQRGDCVAIIGAGATGMINVALSKTLGAEKTFVTDLIDYRLDFAKSFGADFVFDPTKVDIKEAIRSETDDLGVDIAVVTAPSVEAYGSGISVLRKGGKLCVFAPTSPSKVLTLSPKELFFSEVKIVPSYSTSHVETREALELISSRKLLVDRLITHRFRLDQTGEAFATALNSERSLKVIVMNQPL